MITGEDRNRLKAFFSSYYHEDWSYESINDDDVVARYMRSGVDSHELLLLSRALMDYIKIFKTDKDLEDNLINELGCYNQPSASGKRASEWLKSLSFIIKRRAALMLDE